ncbi:putative MFS family arabinose efflux permease [Kribbella aluminosa]|uniref:MFS family arabinose efflux permease n=1 Tax=Kribbella aluminosa TaxID=416017 RepID=A0ABS4UGU2_9ACTN|nr:MFS transporter [Kribbella aluminosa]MBP2350867.1 putative MFS family arabinose efflux permease [Kribbella aluminosa]
MTTQTATRPAVQWYGVGAVTLGIFAIVTTEILPIGLLTPIGADFALTPGRTGWLMTIPGLVAAVAAPVVTVATARLDRRLMLCALMVLLAAAGFLAAAAPFFWLELTARFLVGLTIGGFWSIGAGLAGRLVPEPWTTRATAVIFSAVPLGSVLGVPAGTFVGGLVGWRTSFAALGVLAVLALVALRVSVPPLPPLQVTHAAVLRKALRSSRMALLVTCLIVTAHFATYTYVTPFLREVVRPELIGLFLLVYGAAGLVGNVIAGLYAGRNLRAAFTTCAALIATATLLMPVLGRSTPGALLLLVVWGFGYGGVPVCSMSMFARAVPEREAATVWFTSSFQAVLSTGALLGGLVVDAWSLSVVMVAGGCCAVLTVGVLLWSRTQRVPGT